MVYVDEAKQINILGSRQHFAEKVALLCDFLFFFSAGQIAIFLCLHMTNINFIYQ